LDFAQIGIVIPGRIKQWTEAELLARCIDKTEQDGYLCPGGDIVKTALPPLHFYARAFGWNQDHQFMARVELRHHLRHKIIRPTAIDSDTAKPAHDAAERSAKQTVLAEPMHIHADFQHRQQHQWEIPVAGVRRTDQHVFTLLRQGANHLPAAGAENTPSQQRQCGAEHRYAKNCFRHFWLFSALSVGILGLVAIHRRNRSLSVAGSRLNPVDETSNPCSGSRTGDT